MNISIDIIIPTYNAERHLVQAINSALKQDGIKVNIYVIDDGSTDNTKQIVKKIAHSNSNLHYIYQKNSGLSSARNHGIKAGRGEYIAFLDSDDLWHQDKLSKQLDFFQNSTDSQLGIVYCDYLDINENGKIISYPSYRPGSSLVGDLGDILANGNYIAGSGSGVLARRECFDTVGIFDESLPTCEDWDMWFRIAKSYHFGFIPEKLVSLRRSSGSMSQNHTAMCIGMGKMLKKHSQVYNSKIAVRSLQNTLIKQLLLELPRVQIYQVLRDNLSHKVYKKITNDYYGLFLSFVGNIITKSIGAIRG